MVPQQIGEGFPTGSTKKNTHQQQDQQHQQEHQQQDTTAEDAEFDNDNASSSLTLGSSSSCSLSLWTTMNRYDDLDVDDPFPWENLCLGEDEDQQEEKEDQEAMQSTNGKELSLIHSLDGIPFDADKKPECREEEIRDTIHAKWSPWIDNGQQQEREHNKDKNSCNHIIKTELVPQGGSAMVGKKGVVVKRTKTTRVKKNKKKPKRPLTAYNLFFKAKRPELVQRGLSFESIGQTIGKAWKCLPQEKRQEYKWWAKKDLIRYRRQLALWRAMQRLALQGGLVKDSEGKVGKHQNTATKQRTGAKGGRVISPVLSSFCRSRDQQEKWPVAHLSPKLQHLHPPRTIHVLVTPPPPTGLAIPADRQRSQTEQKGVEEEEERSVGWCQQNLDHRPQTAATPHSGPLPVTPFVLPKIPCWPDRYNYPIPFPPSCYEYGAKPIVSGNNLSCDCTMMTMPQQHRLLSSHDDSAVFPNAQFPPVGYMPFSLYYPEWNACPAPAMAAPGGPHPPLPFLVDPHQQQDYYPRSPSNCSSPHFKVSYTCVRMKESQLKKYMDHLHCGGHFQPVVTLPLHDRRSFSYESSGNTPKNKKQQTVD